MNHSGRYLLDAGSGPVQYQEYLSYSQGYDYRVCADISILALQEARRRIGSHGLFVVADVTHLPFKTGVFNGEVSLHTLHHLPVDDQPRAYAELYRVLAQHCTAVVVNGWSHAPLMVRTKWLVRLAERVGGLFSRLLGKNKAPSVEPHLHAVETETPGKKPAGTFVNKMTAETVKAQLQGQMDFEILVWRSVNVHFLRVLIHPALGGRFWLRILYWIEERFPHFMGEKGQYPLIVIRKGL